MYNVSETFWFRLSTVFRICMFCYWKLITFSLQSTANALALEIKDMMAIKERKTDSVEKIEERQEIAELIYGDIIKHQCHVSNRKDSEASFDDLENVV